ncbi:hypothetical protein QAD02_004779 [Eretmocerus hayati]|uniref:Uncharacterized protein n=1 Tax=Eretmocerus hayati TaxID=131215 RepID=A0ACC2NQY0_9HYME|nr:hypothetical protein QAD02_004779 [Eretmocerus hayati]
MMCHLLAAEILTLCLFYFLPKVESIRGQQVFSVKDVYLFPTLIIEENDARTEEKRLCTGSIITKNQVLTGASCLENAKLQNLLVIMLSAFKPIPGVNSFKVSTKLTYNDFKKKKEETGNFLFQQIEDICILTLNTDRLPITPVSISYDADNPTFASPVKFIGWGTTKDKGLPRTARCAQIQVLKKQECDRISQIAQIVYRKYVWANSVFCAQRSIYPVHAFDADFGGPVLSDDDKLVGIAIQPMKDSGTIVRTTSEEAVFVLRLAHYKEFIQENSH